MTGEACLRLIRSRIALFVQSGLPVPGVLVELEELIARSLEAED